MNNLEPFLPHSCTQTFRILDGKDGKVDGVLNIVQQDRPVNMGRTELSSKAKDELVEGATPVKM